MPIKNKVVVSSTPISERWVFYGFLTLIAWLPLPLGSKYPLGWGIMEIASFSLLSIWLITQLFETRSPWLHAFPTTKVVLLLFVATIGYQLLQVMPLPLKAIHFLSPNTFDVYSLTQVEIPKTSFSISLDIGLTLQELLKSMAYVSLFLLTLVLVNSQKRLEKLVFLLIIVGFSEALLGLTEVYVGSDLFKKPFFVIRGGAVSSATGTYANNNQFGGLLEMAIPLSVGMLMATTVHHPSYSHWRARLAGVTQWLLSPRIWFYLFTTTMITALLYSTSRGANISLIAAASLTTGLIVLFRKSATGEKKSRLLPMLTLPLVIALWLGGHQLFSRFEAQGLETDRQQHREIAYRVIADYPIFGVGSGNWSHVYMAYHSPEYYSHALLNNVHNDYLELLVEQGLIGFILFGSAILLTLGTMIVALCRRQDPLMRGVLFGCVTATLSLLIHSLVDYNLHIPANAAWFTVILAMGLIAARMPSDTSRSG